MRFEPALYKLGPMWSPVRQCCVSTLEVDLLVCSSLEQAVTRPRLGAGWMLLYVGGSLVGREGFEESRFDSPAPTTASTANCVYFTGDVMDLSALRAAPWS